MNINHFKLLRHYAFTHQKIFELTDLTPEKLIPPGVVKKGRGPSGPRTPKKAPKTPEKILEQEEEKSGAETRVGEAQDPSECVSSNGENMSSVRSEDPALGVTEDNKEEEQQGESIKCDSS